MKTYEPSSQEVIDSVEESFREITLPEWIEWDKLIKYRSSQSGEVEEVIYENL